MNISLKWLNEFVDTSNIPLNRLVETLSISGTEIEGIKHLASGTNLVIGEIIECVKHPSSDHLHVCKVNVGNQILQIVCGAPNARVGIKVIVALVGAELVGGKIKKSLILNVESNGMMCSLKELGVDDKFLSEEQKLGIEELDLNAPIGLEPIKYLELDDVILEFKPLPNRGDLLSIYSFAQEVGAVFNLPVKELVENDFGDFKSKYTVSSLTEECNYFLGREVRNVLIQPSSIRIQRYLQASGVRPINNIVDIGNYIMLLTGQPIHMYDLDKIKGKDFIVKQTNDKIQALDGQFYQLENDLGIYINEQFGCIAGVFGGLETSIDENTKNIFIETAIFNSLKIRLTAKRLNLNSDSSQRFVRLISKPRTLLANNLASILVKQTSNSSKVSEIITFDNLKINSNKIEVDISKVNKLLGTSYNPLEVEQVLKQLNFEIETKGSKFVVTPPSYRLDITIWQDVAEEIIRIKGFETLNEVRLYSQNAGGLNNKQKQINLIRQTLVSQGLTENISYMLLNEENAKEFNVLFKTVDNIKIANPLNLERHTLRQSIVVSLLKNRNLNLSYQNSNINIFEIGNVYYGQKPALSLGIVLEEQYKSNHLKGANKADFYTLKGIIYNLLYLLGFKDTEIELTYSSNDFYHPGKSAVLTIRKQKVGIFGYIHPNYVKKYHGKNLLVGELYLDSILEFKTKGSQFTAPTLFPKVSRDLALVIDQKVLYSDIVSSINKLRLNILQSIELFDVYQGANIPEGKKSIALSFVLQDKTKTLLDSEIVDAMQKIVEKLELEFKADIRK